MADHEKEAVLLLEDQALIALYMEELLQQAGFPFVNICSSCSAAASWLEAHTPELAVIETRLRDGSSDSIAVALAARGIPYIIHSGDSDQKGDHPLMESKCRWITKPCNPDDFLDAVRECCPVL